MRLFDMLFMSCSNLWKRKIRTILTILGVIIGVSSIVVMVSLGLGLSKMSLEMVEQYGGLTTINVSEARAYDNTVKEKDKKHLDDDLVALIESDPRVNRVDPILEIQASAKSGAYEGYLTIRGMTPEGLKNIKQELADGELPLNDAEVDFLYGNQVILDFYNSRTNSGYWSDGNLPDIDLKESTIFVTYDTDGAAAFASGDSYDDEGNVTSTRPPKKHLASYSGVLKGGPEDYSDNSWYVFTNITALESLLKREFRGKVIPGQPTRPNGKAYKDIFYTTLKVDVPNIDDMAEVQTWITELGYQADSNSEWVQQTKQQSGYIQAVLGGIGAVSLIVAAIGITNTMMMSIYERTREIGVMKVLGCDMGNIRDMFLMEAGFIGFFGGIAGTVLSYLISFIINKVTVSMGVAQDGATLSFIPIWLAFVGVIFAVFVGMLSGFLPARRAMQLSPLAAIRNE